MIDYRGKNYPTYFITPHWAQLKDTYIYSNPTAHCWICNKRYTLLPHHVSYLHLFHERPALLFLFWLFGDFVIVCFACHEEIHFIKFLFFCIKVPLKRRYLVRRMLFLKAKYYIRKRWYISSLWYFLAFLVN